MDAKKTIVALGAVLLALSGTAVGQESYIVRPDITDCVHVRDDASLNRPGIPGDFIS